MRECKDCMYSHLNFWDAIWGGDKFRECQRPNQDFYGGKSKNHFCLAERSQGDKLKLCGPQGLYFKERYT